MFLFFPVVPVVIAEPFYDDEVTTTTTTTTTTIVEDIPPQPTQPTQPVYAGTLVAKKDDATGRFFVNDPNDGAVWLLNPGDTEYYDDNNRTFKIVYT